jgi:hypothetical protein
MGNFSEFFKDSDGRYSMSRLIFFVGVVNILSLATCQFFGLGMLSTALYGILSTLVSGGYAVSKYNDRLESTTIQDASRDESTDNIQ